MLINWICLISIIVLVAQVMVSFYMNAVSDLKPRKTIARRTARAKAKYNNELNYKDKIAK